jgi:hypothetical protein
MVLVLLVIPCGSTQAGAVHVDPETRTALLYKTEEATIGDECGRHSKPKIKCGVNNCCLETHLCMLPSMFQASKCGRGQEEKKGAMEKVTWVCIQEASCKLC